MEHWPPELLHLVFSFFKTNFSLVADLSLESQSLANAASQMLSDKICLPVRVETDKEADLIACAAAFGCEVIIQEDSEWEILETHPQAHGLKKLKLSKAVSWSTRAVSEFNHLISLNMEEQNKLTAMDLLSFACLKSLTSLTIGHKNPLGKEFIPHASFLNYLTYHSPPFSMLHLKSLTIGRQNSLGVQGARYFSSFENLTSLTIDDQNELECEGARHLSLLKRLVFLSIGSTNRLTSEGVRHLSRLSNLQTFVIGSDNAVGEKGACHLSKLYSLTSLSIGDRNNLGVQGAFYLSSLPTLTTLRIGGWNQLGAEGARHLSKLKALTSLWIGEYNRIGAEGVCHLSSLDSLKTLAIKSVNDLGVKAVRYLMRFKKLVDLEIGSWNEIIPLLTSLGNTKTFKRLEINDDSWRLL